MFRTSQGPSSGSHNLFLTEVTGFCVRCQRTQKPVTSDFVTIGFFFENNLHWQFEVEKNVYKRLFYATCSFTYQQNINTYFRVSI
jgi:hypothetical protein